MTGGETYRIETKKGNLTFVLKKRIKGRNVIHTDLFCMTHLQGFRLYPTKSYWQKKYINLATLAMLDSGDIPDLDTLASWCHDDMGNEVIRWELVNRKYI